MSAIRQPPPVAERAFGGQPSQLSWVCAPNSSLTAVVPCPRQRYTEGHLLGEEDRRRRRPARRRRCHSRVEEPAVQGTSAQLPCPRAPSMMYRSLPVSHELLRGFLPYEFCNSMRFSGMFEAATYCSAVDRRASQIDGCLAFNGMVAQGWSIVTSRIASRRISFRKKQGLRGAPAPYE